MPQVRLIDDDGAQIGIKSTDDALKYAWDKNLDLVEVAPEARPPVCRVMDYSKYRYEQEQKAKLARKHQSTITIKEIKLRPKIGIGDYETKKGHVVRFLKNRAKVKVTIMFRGREMTHPERGRDLLLRLAEDVKDLGAIESQPLQDGRNMVMMLAPHKAVRARQAGAGRPGRDAAEAPADAPADAADEAATAPDRRTEMPKMKTIIGREEAVPAHAPAARCCAGVRSGRTCSSTRAPKRRRMKRRDKGIDAGGQPRGAAPPGKAIGWPRWHASSAASTARRSAERCSRRPRATAGLKKNTLPQGERADAEVALLRLPRPPHAQARLPPALDHPHQRRRPPARPVATTSSCSACGRPRSSSTARCSPTSRSPIRRRSGRSPRRRRPRLPLTAACRGADHLARQRPPEACAQAPGHAPPARAGAVPGRGRGHRRGGARGRHPARRDVDRRRPPAGRGPRRAARPRRPGARGATTRCWPRSGRPRPPGPRDRASTTIASLPRETSGARYRCFTLDVYLHRVIDPGNVGTVVRACGALGPARLSLSPGCSDPLAGEGRARVDGRGVSRPDRDRRRPAGGRRCGSPSSPEPGRRSGRPT